MSTSPAASALTSQHPALLAWLTVLWLACSYVLPHACRYAELLSDQRPFSEDELALFQQSARASYEDFRNKAALSRRMEEARMEEKAQVCYPSRRTSCWG